MKFRNSPIATRPYPFWFVGEWEPYYCLQGAGDARSNIEIGCDRDALPIALVALEADGAVLGIAALKLDSVGSRIAQRPWLATFLVGPDCRGLGAALIEVIEKVAQGLNLRAVYVSTDATERMIKLRGWQAVGAAQSLKGEVAVGCYWLVGRIH